MSRTFLCIKGIGMKPLELTVTLYKQEDLKIDLKALIITLKISNILILRFKEYY